MKKSQSSDYFNRLEKGLGIDEEGNVSAGKNLEAGGNIFTLNGKQWGIMPAMIVSGKDCAPQGFILSDCLPHYTENGNISVSGIWFDIGQNDFLGFCPNEAEVIIQHNETRIENGILYFALDENRNFKDKFKSFASNNQ